MRLNGRVARVPRRVPRKLNIHEEVICRSWNDPRAVFHALRAWIKDRAPHLQVEAYAAMTEARVRKLSPVAACHEIRKLISEM